MVHRGQAVLVAVVVAGVTLVSTKPAMVQERGDITVQSLLGERALVPLGVDNTYSNYDVWIPKACRAGSWTGFQFDLPASNSCFGALYDGAANPFASPPGGVAGVAGTMGSGPTGTLIDWTNNLAPVVAGGGLARDGHFGYQFLNNVCSFNANIPSAAWHRDGTMCPLKKAHMELVADDSVASGSDGTLAQVSRAQVVVWNDSDETIAIGLAAALWPDGSGPAPSDETLLARLRPDDPAFISAFDGVPLEYQSVEPGRFTSYAFDLPDTTMVVLAKYEVTSIMGEERGAEYDVYVAFGTDTRFEPLEPGPTEPTSEPPTETATPSITVTPLPTPVSSPPAGLFLPSAIFEALATFP